MATYTPEQIHRYEIAARSEGNRSLVVIERAVAELRKLVAAFIEAHPDECECDYCTCYPSTAAGVVEDLTGLAYNLMMGASCLGSITLDWANESDTADTPAVVTTPTT